MRPWSGTQLALLSEEDFVFQRILFPLDGSELAERSLQLRAQVAAPTAEHVLFRVLDDRPESKQEAETYLAKLCEGLTAGGAKSVARVATGDPADAILQEVDAIRPGLVVMASHGRSGLRRLIRGSVAERVLRHCRAPLLLATPPALEGDATFKSILVPHDCSERAGRTLPLIVEAAKRWGAAVKLLHVLPLPPPLPSPYFLEQEWSEERVMEYLQPSVSLLTDAGVEFSTTVRVGYAASEILRESEQADLIAIATHGRTGASRWWFGSVAEQVLRHCEVPVLVQREQED
jgi:nucleotide-binding universal stress UspA family protein